MDQIVGVFNMVNKIFLIGRVGYLHRKACCIWDETKREGSPGKQYNQFSKYPTSTINCSTNSQVLAAEAEFNRLNRRVQELEEDLETTETKFVLASQKLDKAATTADDSDRMKKVLENRAAEDEKKLIRLAEELKEAQKMAEDADKKYDDTQKKMSECERNLEVNIYA